MKVNLLKINDLDLRSGDFLFWPRNLFNVDSEVILNTTYSDGKSFNRNKVNERKFILNGVIKGNIPENLLYLSGLLNSKGTKKLIIGIPGSPIRCLDILIQNNGINEPYCDTVSYQVVAPDPYFYSDEVKTINLGAVSNNSLTFPLTFPISFGAITGGQGIVTNDGNGAAYPVITIIGTCSSMVITNETTGESMSLNISLGASDTLVVDSRPKTRGVYLNDIKRMDLKNGDWLSCIPGDNQFSFLRNSLETKQHCTIELQSRWI